MNGVQTQPVIKKAAPASKDNSLSLVERAAVNNFIRQSQAIIEKHNQGASLATLLINKDQKLSHPDLQEGKPRRGRKASTAGPAKLEVSAGEADEKKPKTKADRYLAPHASLELREGAMSAAVDVLDDHWKLLKDHYESIDPTKSYVLEFIARVIEEHKPSARLGRDETDRADGAPKAPNFLQKTMRILGNSGSINRHLMLGHNIFAPGLYQLMRRYKHWVEVDDYEWTRKYFHHPENQCVIIELLYVNKDPLECLLINCEGEVHIGSMFVNQDDFMNILFSRRVGNHNNDASQHMKVRQRYLSLKLDREPRPCYSGVSIKRGDASERPVASELLLLRLADAPHAPAYAECKKLYEEFSEADDVIFKKVPETSTIYDYITFNPPRSASEEQMESIEWRIEKHIRQIRDIPGLIDLALPEKNTGVIRFAEPSRALSDGFLDYLGEKFKIFQWSDIQGTANK